MHVPERVMSMMPAFIDASIRSSAAATYASAMGNETEGGLVLQTVRCLMRAAFTDPQRKHTSPNRAWNRLGSTRSVSISLGSASLSGDLFHSSVLRAASSFSPSLGGLRLLGSREVFQKGMSRCCQGEKFDRGHHGLIPAYDFLIAMAWVIPMADLADDQAPGVRAYSGTEASWPLGGNSFAIEILFG
ncbi:hypothetical protein C8R45DRAFT_928920 [Mycena sanguinolenta]|nr:hypothetical protein C8R45DRAFT_928920 [Mycena sanguinolenta]